LTCYGADKGIPFPDGAALAVENSGALWIGGVSQLIRWQANKSQIFAPPTLEHSDGLEGFKAVVVAADGSVWSGVMTAGPGLGLEHYERGVWSPLVKGDTNSSAWEVTALSFDRDQSLWVGTANNGIYRISEGNIDHFGVSDGLTADSVLGFCEDHEGDMWAVTPNGIDKFRATRVATFSSRQGLSGDSADAVLATKTGSIWVSNATGLDKIQNGAVTTYREHNGLTGTMPTALFEDTQGRVWFGVDDGVALLDAGHFARVQSKSGAIGPVRELAQGPGSTVWASKALLPSRLLRMNAESLLESINTPPGTRIFALAADGDGVPWMTLANPEAHTCNLARYSEGAWQRFGLGAAEHGVCGDMAVKDAHTIFTIWPGGIVEWHDGVVRTITRDNGLPCDSPSALVFDGQQNLWLYLQCGIAMIEAGQLESWWKDPAHNVAPMLLDTADGALPGRADFHPRAVSANDGKIWFANSRYLQFVDPAHWRSNAVMPPVQVRALYGDGQSFARAAPIVLPPRTRDVQIDFTALSFVIPQRVRFKYKLEGWDTDWKIPEARRQAFYTNLRPGKYRFAVVASNEDGLWNTHGDSLEFSIAPAFFQTWWFRTLCVVVAVMIAQSAYLFALRRAKLNIRQRLAARLTERERIARELHDTLLQSIQWVMLKCDAVANGLPLASSARSTLKDILTRGDELMAEGRARVRDLRGADIPPTELAAQLSSFASRFQDASDIEFRASTVGRSVPLNPIVSDELLQIGREAVANAFTHGQARRIEVELIYGRKLLVLRVRDDGKGMTAETLEAGRENHWGLVGMRERAGNLAGKLNIWSQPGSGTEVEIVIPANMAYAQRHAKGRRSLINRLAGVLRSRTWRHRRADER
jgi:signal transduction histidine kinase/streptogramin lyase